MNKPIIQLVVFLLFVIFITFALIKYCIVFESDREKQVAASLDILLSKDKPDLEMLDSKAKDERNLNLYRFIQEIKKEIADGLYDKAEDNLRNLLLFYPKNRTVLSLLGGILYSRGDYEQAQSMFMLMRKNNPDDAFARESLGLTFEKQFKHNEAIEEFLNASLLKPDSASTYIHLAGLYSLAGDKTRAIYNFAKAYEIIDVDIIPLSFDPAFDNIRGMPTFINIINNAEDIVRMKNNLYLKNSYRRTLKPERNSILINFKK